VNTLSDCVCRHLEPSDDPVNGETASRHLNVPGRRMLRTGYSRIDYSFESVLNSYMRYEDLIGGDNVDYGILGCDAV
jgi:hypothetical protein